MDSKAGQLNTLGPAVIALVIAGVFLILGLIIIQEFKDTNIVSQANSATATNETLTTVEDLTGEYFAANLLCGAACGSVSEVFNATTGDAIPSTNYTQTGCYIIYSGGTGDSGGFNNSNWNVTYTYTYGDEACTASNDTLVGLGTFADFWEIIVLAVIITIVIGLLLVVFGGRSRR